VSNLTKKQIALTLVIVAFAAAMIVGTVASATSDNLAFAKHKQKHHKHHKSHGGHNHESSNSVSQANSNRQSVVCQASGGISIGTGNGGIAGTGVAITPSAGINNCPNTNTNANANTGNQAAAS
jgi:hypothetical protein